MNIKVLFRVRKAGYCCAFAYFQANETRPELELARELSISPRTVRIWRRRLREQLLTCSRFTPCFQIAAERLRKSQSYSFEPD